ncbi:bifunctional diguanylate cyclase/phosphodiesterase [Caulobacter sp. UNC358MFTsu5.1]|uniref:putative bifunctional diguanylate cyclase/phosphodiesterase n=1 Tax=Caulobacter sp. UNC358MFTsu5.1 TaxID=1449049 RepID=UPI001E5EB1A5|nr:EAL domain-containing protein [Caulobacter sp. UNC358MFTsu5.1]
MRQTSFFSGVISGTASRAAALLSRHLTAVPEAMAGRVRFEQLASIQRLTPVMMAANIINAQLVCLAGLGGTHRLTLLVWAGVVTCYALLGLRGWVAARRRKSGKNTVSARGVRRVALQAGLLGFIWGLLPALALHDAGLHMSMLVVALMAGMIGVGSFALLTLPVAALAYTTPLVVGSLWVLLTSHEPILLALAGLLIFCYLVVGLSCLSHAKVFVDRLVAGDELERQKQVVSLLLSDFEEGSSDWLWEVDAAGALTYVSERMAEAAGRPREDLLGRRVSELGAELAEAPEGLSNLGGLLIDQKAFRDVVVSVLVGDELHWWALSGKPIHDLDGAFAGFRGVGADVTQARKDQERIKRLAHYDVLTGLPNRLSFLQALSAAWDAKGKTSGCAVLCLDLDHFKGVNDSLGHPIGDALLAEAAGRLRACVGETGVVTRLGGDEFAVVVRDHLAPAELGALAQAIVDALSQPYELNDHHVSIGASVGIAVAPADADDADTLLKNADLALYRAKGDGRGAYRFFEATMDLWAQERRALEIDLRSALKNDELKLFFQPLIGAKAHETIGFEALLRWQHPRRGLVGPDDFIECAEQWGLICKIGEWVLNEACRQAAAWPAPLKVAVNLSPNQFAAGDLVDQVRAALEASGLAPSRLELEITEGLLLRDTAGTLEQLKALKDLGVRIAMDDFGTGYSSLAYLWRFPFDKIKIDRTFVAEMAGNPAIADILRTITLLGRTLNLEVTAEGVETADQARILEDMRCDHFQGYLFGRPMPIADIPGFLLDNTAQQMRRIVLDEAAESAAAAKGA